MDSTNLKGMTQCGTDIGLVLETKTHESYLKNNNRQLLFIWGKPEGLYNWVEKIIAAENDTTTKMYC